MIAMLVRNVSLHSQLDVDVLDINLSLMYSGTIIRRTLRKVQACPGMCREVSESPRSPTVSREDSQTRTNDDVA